MSLRVLRRADVERALEPEALLGALATGFRKLSAGEALAPPRTQLDADGGFLLSMPAHVPGSPLAVKAVTVFPGNDELGLPTHGGVVTLFDGATGQPRAILDGGAITELRTAGAAVLAARLVRASGYERIAVVGSGAQARAHLALAPELLGATEVLVVARSAARGEELVRVCPGARLASLDDALANADALFLCTSSAQPLFAAGAVRPGVHVSSVGFAPPGGELDPALARTARLLVESRAAFVAPPVGCAELAGLDAGESTELGELLRSDRPGLEPSGERTVYKSMGHAVEDLVVASAVLEAAEAAQLGTTIAL